MEKMEILENLQKFLETPQTALACAREFRQSKKDVNRALYALKNKPFADGILRKISGTPPKWWIEKGEDEDEEKYIRDYLVIVDDGNVHDVMNNMASIGLDVTVVTMNDNKYENGPHLTVVRADTKEELTMHVIHEAMYEHAQGRDVIVCSKSKLIKALPIVQYGIIVCSGWGELKKYVEI